MDGENFMVPNPIKMDDLGVPLFLETPTIVSYKTNILPSKSEHRVQSFSQLSYLLKEAYVTPVVPLKVV